MELATKALVDIEHAHREFDSVVAVDDVTLTLRAGEILGLYGPSGAGKTTTIRLALGVHLPSAGSVRIFGVPSHRLGARQREQLGYSPQQFLYPPALSAEETVSLAAGMYGKGPFGVGRLVRTVLEKVELWEKRKYRVGSMSGGERRRVGNAAALVHRPRLVFLDEPTTGLDPMLRKAMWEWFRELRDEGRSLLITGHYMAEAEFCDRIALIVEGKVTGQGTPAELRRLALGGEIVEIVVGGRLTSAVDALRDEALVKSVAIRGTDQLWVTVDEAGPSLPVLVDCLHTRDIEITSIKEIRPPFDEIYQRLVERGA